VVDSFLGIRVLPLRDGRFAGPGAVSAARNEELGAFLRTRRARVSPEQSGLPATPRRRVPGLRREELAQLAGVSPDYYTRLEQGRQVTASLSVLDAVARALGLTADERSHLHTLAGVRSATVRVASSPRTVDPRAQRVLDLLGDTPAILCGRFLDILVGNDAAKFLFADFDALPISERNAVRWILLDPVARELYGPEWESAASELIGMLRLEAGRDPENARLAEIVAELTEASPLFRENWREHRVTTWLHEVKVLRHPSAGLMEFRNEAIAIHNVPDQAIYLVMPVDGSSFATAFGESRNRPRHHR
jgi:transcriptional regulator with XRE-family HTH domain